MGNCTLTATQSFFLFFSNWSKLRAFRIPINAGVENRLTLFSREMCCKSNRQNFLLLSVLLSSRLALYITLIKFGLNAKIMKDKFTFKCLFIIRRSTNVKKLVQASISYVLVARLFVVKNAYLALHHSFGWAFKLSPQGLCFWLASGRNPLSVASWNEKKNIAEKILLVVFSFNFA